jgi:hypothetical protein
MNDWQIHEEIQRYFEHKAVQPLRPIEVGTCQGDHGHCPCVDELVRLTEVLRPNPSQYAYEALNLRYFRQVCIQRDEARQALEAVRRSANANARRIGVIPAVPKH